MISRRKLILLMGINGAGKTTIARKLAERLAGHVYFGGEEAEFERLFVDNVDRNDSDLHRRVIEHCRKVICNFPPSPEGSTVVVDRWYETYVTGSGLLENHVAEIEDAILRAGFDAYVVNLVVNDDLPTMIRRLEQTRSHRPEDWWEPHLGTLEERAFGDLGNQHQNRLFAFRSKLNYMELDTTDMQWDAVMDRIIKEVQPQH